MVVTLTFVLPRSQATWHIIIRELRLGFLLYLASCELRVTFIQDIIGQKILTWPLLCACDINVLFQVKCLHFWCVSSAVGSILHKYRMTLFILLGYPKMVWQYCSDTVLREIAFNMCSKISLNTLNTFWTRYYKPIFHLALAQTIDRLTNIWQTTVQLATSTIWVTCKICVKINSQLAEYHPFKHIIPNYF